MARAKQPVSINGIEFDALIDESRTLRSTIPQYAVEDGFTISDTIILGAEELSMTLYVTDTPVTWYAKHGAEFGRTERIVKQLEELYYSKVAVAVVTTDQTYSDMAIETIEFSKTAETGYARQIPISFKKIPVTSTKTTSIPDSYGKSGKTKAQNGSANTSQKTAETNASGNTSAATNSSGNGKKDSKSSILYSAASSLGLL